jgi:hypothetical protein
MYNLAGFMEVRMYTRFRSFAQQPNWFDDTFRNTEVTLTERRRRKLQFSGFGRHGRRYTLTIYRDELDPGHWTVECRTNERPREYHTFTDDELRAAFGIGRRPHVDDPLADLFGASFVEPGKFARRGNYLVIPGPEDTDDREWPAHRAAASIKIKRWHKQLVEELLSN